MISALEASMRSQRRISSGASEQLKEIEDQMMKQFNSDDVDIVGYGCYYYETDLLKAEVRVLLKKLGYKVIDKGLGYSHKRRYCIDWREAVKPKYTKNNIYWLDLLKKD